jgi:SPP1 family predicted phage head-tail adaptor
VTALSGRELETAQQIAAEIDYAVLLRYDTRITAKMRVNYGARQFEIMAVLNDEWRRTRTRLLCKELNPSC